MVKAKLMKLFHIYLISVAALFVVLVIVSLGRWVFPFGHHFPTLLRFPPLLPLAFAGIGAIFLLMIFVWIGIGVAVYYDAKQRGMEPLLWALVAMLIPYLLGLIAYLITRHPIQSVCPACGQSYTSNDVFCKQCGHAVQTKCPSCGRPASTTARFCPNCGTPLSEPPAPSAGKPVVL